MSFIFNGIIDKCDIIIKKVDFLYFFNEKSI